MRISLQDLLDIRTGYQAREGLESSPEGTHFAVQAKDIDAENDHVLLSGQLDRVVATRDFSPYTIHDGDLLFLARGNRRSATLVEDLPKELPTIALYYFFILRPKTTLIDPAFLTWIINEAEAQDYLDKVTTRTGMPFVTKKSFGALELDIPSLAIQAEIVRLHKLGRRERQLLRQLTIKRSQLIRSACLQIYGKQEDT